MNLVISHRYQHQSVSTSKQSLDSGGLHIQCCGLVQSCLSPQRAPGTSSALQPLSSRPNMNSYSTFSSPHSQNSGKQLLETIAISKIGESATTPTPVVLFRTPADSADPYHVAFDSSRNYAPESISVLEQFFVDLEGLARVIESGPSRWAGVIATSTRACEAWVSASGQIADEYGSDSDWSELYLFVPGISTAEPLSGSGLPSKRIPKVHPDIKEHPPGSAAKLADLIISHTSPCSLPFLFLTGDKTLPDLPARLRTAGRDLVMQQVYETGERAELASELRRRFVDKHERLWLVFFAPSSAKMVLDHLEELGLLSLPGGENRMRLAAIGSTTAVYLTDQGLAVAATAKQPTPAGLRQAIEVTDTGA